MRKASVLLLAVVAGVALLSAGSLKMALSFKNPGYTGGTLKNILVLALNGKSANRAQFEDELVAAITRPGVTAVQSYVFLPRPDATPINMDDLRVVIKDQNFDGVVAARLTKADNTTVYVPGTVYTPLPYYGTLAGYYGAMVPVVYSPGYMQTVKIAQVETNAYFTPTSLPDGQLVWTGTTNTFNAGSAMKAIKNLVKLVAQELENQGVIPPKS